jgi:hypothetical protein
MLGLRVLSTFFWLSVGAVGARAPAHDGHLLAPVEEDPAGSFAEDQERREAHLLARGSSVRADFSQVQLTYLGRDRLLSFNQWTGEYDLWQYGARTSVSTPARPSTQLPTH